MVPSVTPRPASSSAPGVPDVVRLVVLGDSVAAPGQGEASYAPWLARHLEEVTGARVTVINKAVSGWTTRDVLALVRRNPDVRMALAEADVVTVNAGGNDLLPLRLRYGLGTCGGSDGEECLRAGVQGFATRWENLLDEIVEARGSSDGVAVADLYHPSVELERSLGTFQVSKHHLDEANRRLRRAADDRAMLVADVYAAFNGTDGQDDPGRQGLVGIDGVHPTVRGAEVIAGAFAALDLIPLP